MSRPPPTAFDPARAIRRKLLLVVDQIETVCRELPAVVDRLNVERELEEIVAALHRARL